MIIKNENGKYSSNNYCQYDRDLAQILETPNEVTLLNELIHEHKCYDQYGKLENGFFYSTVSNIKKFTLLGRTQQENAIKGLEDKNLIECVAKGYPKKRYFKINFEKLNELQSQSVSMSKTNKLNDLSMSETNVSVRRKPTYQYVENQQTDTSETNDKIDINKKDINKDIKEREERETPFPPSLSDVIDYASSIGYSEAKAKEFHDYYTSCHWKTTKGNRVSDWKAKLKQWKRNEKDDQSCKKSEETKTKESEEAKDINLNELWDKVKDDK